MAFDWTQYAVSGAQRPDSFSGMNPSFSSALERMFAGAPDNVRSQLRVMSGYRSPERQQQLWDQALQKYGSPEAARKWVAPPGNSQHNHGTAADLRYLDPEALSWAHANAQNYGLAFPLSNENWHIELAGARGQPHQPQQQKPDVIAEVLAAGGHPVMGSMAPAPSASFTTPQAPQSAPTASGPIPPAVQQMASGAPVQGQGNALSNIFGMMAAAPQQQSPFSPVDIRGPSPQQANALSSLLQSLRGRIA